MNTPSCSILTPRFSEGVCVEPQVRPGDRSARAAEFCLLACCLLVPLGKPIAVKVLGIDLRLGILDLLTVPTAIVFLLRLKALKLSWPVVFILSYGFAAIVSTLFTTSPEVRVPTFLRAARLCAILLPFLVATTLDFEATRLDRLMRMFLIGGGISLGIGLVVWAFHKHLGVNLYVATILTNSDKFEAPRASGVFGDYIAYGHLAAVWFLMAFFRMARLSGFRQWAASTGVLSVTLCALVASLSRGALLYLAVAMPTLLFSPWPPDWKRALRKSALAIGCSLAVFVVIGLFWRPGPLGNGLQLLHMRINTVGISAAFNGQWDVATSNRLGNWATYAGLIGENPVTGIGYKALYLSKGIPPDNTYLGTLVETGVIGFAALMGFLFATLRDLKSASGSFPPALFVMALWAGCLVEGITNDFLTFWGTTPALMAVTGAVITAPAQKAATRLRRQDVEDKGIQ